MPHNQDNEIPTSSRKRRFLLEPLFRRTSLEKRLITALVLSFMLLALLIYLLAAQIVGSMDRSVDPCVDFYSYVCGRWSDVHFGPKSESNSWFLERSRYINYLLTDILESENQENDLDSLKQARALYRMCMDTERMNDLGFTPLLDVLDAIGLPHTLPNAETATNFNIGKTLATAQRLISADILIQLSTTDVSNDTILVIDTATGDLSLLPVWGSNGREGTTDNRQAMLHRISYISSVITELDTSQTNVTAVATAAFKIILLESQLKLDAENGLHENGINMKISELQEIMTPKHLPKYIQGLRFDWLQYISTLSEGLNITLTMDSTIKVINVPYFRALANRLASTKPKLIQRYVWWKIVETIAPYTTNAMRTYKRVYRDSVIGNRHVPRTVLCTYTVRSFMNFVLSYKMATLKDISETSSKVAEIVFNVKEALKEMILNSKWIDQNTKLSALRKADAIEILVGYPKELLNPNWIEEYYENVKLVDGEYVRSIVSVTAWDIKRSLERLNTNRKAPGDVTRKDFSWFVDALNVNAYYNRETNMVAIPAGILQAPFYINGIHWLNYGSIGSIAGHEITHGFDNEGKEFDWEGKINNWWSREMSKGFADRAKCYVDQYNKYVITDIFKVNGTRTLAENIADNGGIKEAYFAYRKFLSQEGAVNEQLLPGLENYTPQQLFFIAFANVWCRKKSRNSYKADVIDEHSPSQYRVIGSLQNFEEFSKAWSCPANSPMNPYLKCGVW